MRIDDLKAPKGANKKKKYVGRGTGSGHGKTSTRGHKGQGQRSGRGPRPGFEGGSVPLARRLPKRGFRSYRNPTSLYQIVNIEQLNRFSKGVTVNPLNLREEGLIKDDKATVKLLGNGKLQKNLHVKVNAISKSARKKVEESGSTIELI